MKHQDHRLFAKGTDKGILHFPQFVIDTEILYYVQTVISSTVLSGPELLQNPDLFRISHDLISFPFELLTLTNQGSGQ